MPSNHTFHLGFVMSIHWIHQHVLLGRIVGQRNLCLQHFLQQRSSGRNYTFIPKSDVNLWEVMFNIFFMFISISGNSLYNLTNTFSDRLKPSTRFHPSKHHEFQRQTISELFLQGNSCSSRSSPYNYRVITPLIGVKSPQYPIDYRPFIGAPCYFICQR